MDEEYATTPLAEKYHVSSKGWWFALGAMTQCDGMEAAKAAAQADYEQRILSTLTLSPAGVTEGQVEAAWKALCDADADIAAGIGFVEGVVGHNIVRAALEAAAKARPRDYTDFVEWLKAAFDAGRSAQPSISTGQGEPVADPSFPDALRDSEIRIWINACNHGPARQALRQLLAYRVRGPSLPAGHVAVPVEPTEEMMKAMGDAFFDAAIGHVAGDLASVNEPFRRFYRAMLAALPHNQGEGKPSVTISQAAWEDIQDAIAQAIGENK